MRELYKREKKRVGYARWWCLASICFFYYAELQTQVPSYQWGIRAYEENAGTLLSFDNVITTIWGILLVAFVNSKLFFIEEEGKRVYLLEKYRIAPVCTKKLYQIRIWYLLETILYFMLGTCFIYVAMTIANNCMFSLTFFLLGVARMSGILLLMMVLLLVFVDYFQEWRLQKK